MKHLDAHRVSRFARETVCVAIACLSYGCAMDAVDGTGPEIEALPQELGTVQGHANSHLNTAASESVVTSMSSNFEITSSFNATDSTQFVTYNNNSRQVFANASLMGWTQMDASGNTVSTGRLRPPSGWSVLWGDPAITRNRANSNLVYLTQLAVPTSKFNLSPTPGRIEGPLIASVAGLCNAYVGGACIARSTDGGRTFSLPAWDCVSHATSACPNGIFYDGSDIETSSNGMVFAAYRDTNNSKIDVFMATTPTELFALTTNTAPINAVNHPRIKWGPGGLYLLVQDGAASNRLSLTRYQGSNRSGTWTTPVIVTNQYDSSSIALSDRSIRVGPQYDLDIGKNEAGADELRIVFKVLESGHHHLRVYKCTTGATITCSRVSGWETAVFGAGNDQFMPTIATGERTGGGVAWVATYFDRAIDPTGNRVNLMRSVVSQSGSTFQIDRVTLENAQTPCPDTRGYWGDYDSMAFGAFGFFMRPFSDSSHGACSQSQFTSAPLFSALHMSAIQ